MISDNLIELYCFYLYSRLRIFVDNLRSKFEISNNGLPDGSVLVPILTLLSFHKEIFLKELSERKRSFFPSKIYIDVHLWFIFSSNRRERILKDYEEFDNLYLFLTRRVSFTSEIIYIFVMVLPSSDGT